jgi:hypothetical protein
VSSRKSIEREHRCPLCPEGLPEPLLSARRRCSLFVRLLFILMKQDLIFIGLMRLRPDGRGAPELGWSLILLRPEALFFCM